MKSIHFQTAGSVPPSACAPAPQTPNGSAAAPAKEKPPRTAWLYADALNEAKLLQDFLKEMVGDPSGRHGNLQAALRHNLRLNILLKSLIDEEES